MWGNILYSRTGYRMTNTAHALCTLGTKGYKHTRRIFIVIFFHCNHGYAKAPHYYVTRGLPVLLHLWCVKFVYIGIWLNRNKKQGDPAGCQSGDLNSRCFIRVYKCRQIRPCWATGCKFICNNKVWNYHIIYFK